MPVHPEAFFDGMLFFVRGNSVQFAHAKIANFLTNQNYYPSKFENFEPT